MAKPEYVTNDRYLADFRAELGSMRVDMAQMDVRVTRWVPMAAGGGGLLGGLMAAAVTIVG